MVICAIVAIVGCCKNSKRVQGISFYRLPAVISHQGDRAQELSQKPRGPEKYSNTRVCSRHFVSGKGAVLCILVCMDNVCPGER